MYLDAAKKQEIFGLLKSKKSSASTESLTLTPDRLSLRWHCFPTVLLI